MFTGDINLIKKKASNVIGLFCAIWVKSKNTDKWEKYIILYTVHTLLTITMSIIQKWY